jgi:hypothetical protein
MRVVVHVKWPVFFVYDFDNLKVSTDFKKIPQDRISLKFVHPFSSVATVRFDPTLEFPK